MKTYTNSSEVKQETNFLITDNVTKEVIKCINNYLNNLN